MNTLSSSAPSTPNAAKVTAAPATANSTKNWLKPGRFFLIVILALLLLGLALPMLMIFNISLSDGDGNFVGFANFAEYFASGHLAYSIQNTLLLGVVITALVIVLAFTYAYALNRSRMVGKKFFKAIAFLPILAPSLMPAISLVYLFGNQGVVKELLLGHDIYGMIGIVMGLSFWCFPHAMMIINTALSSSDQRLYEASRTLGASKLRTFMTVTLPTAKYGLISAALVVFTLAITDFGVPKVIGGQFNVLATDIYKQVVGQQNFQIGAVISMVILLPALISFLIDRHLQKHQKEMIDHRAVPYVPEKNPLRDWLLFGFCSLMGVIILAFIGMAIYASFVSFWPYNLTLSLNNYNFGEFSIAGWDPYFNSLIMASLAALFGTVFVFITAYLVQKIKAYPLLRNSIQMIALLPMAIPGLVLGLAYIFFFNHPDNPLNIIYGGMSILVISTIIHYYTVSHITAVTALKQIDKEVESVSASLKIPQWVTFYRVSLPLSLPAVLDIGFYYFVNAMTTVSAVVFLYSPDTSLASIAVLNMDDAGDIAPAAAMATLIFVTAVAAKLVYLLVSAVLLKKTQAWRAR